MTATHLAAVRDAAAYWILAAALALLAFGALGLLANWMERRVSPGTDRQEHVGEKRGR